MDKDLPVFIAVVLTIIGVLFAVAYFAASASCSASWEDSGFQHTFSFLGGCRIQIEDGSWIPADNYRKVK